MVRVTPFFSTTLIIPQQNRLRRLASRPTRNFCTNYSTKRHVPASTSPDSNPSRHQPSIIGSEQRTTLTEGLWKVLKSTRRLLAIAPVFHVNPEDVVVLKEPTEFYETLKNSILSARYRVVLAALYIGSKEAELVSAIRTALQTRQARNENDASPFEVTILVDCLRGTRGGASKSTASLLLTLVKEFPQNVRVHLYHTPDLNGVKKRLCPPRFNETIGLMHIKSYVVDDGVIMSGANLSKDYFTNRQDRYIYFRNNKQLADYFTDLVHTIGSLSYTLRLPRSQSTSTSSVDYDLDASTMPDPVSDSKEFKKVAVKRMSEFLERWKEQTETTRIRISNALDSSAATLDGSTINTVVFPSLQMGPFGIRQDEEATVAVMETANAYSAQTTGERRDSGDKGAWRMHVTSGYFNFGPKYVELMLSEKSGAVFELLAASPEANGFFKSDGVSRYLPPAYTYIEQQFLKKVVRFGRTKDVTLREWKREGWTYHAKGLWCYLPSETLPSISMIGSPNFGYRSTERDLEAQMVLCTDHEGLRIRLHQELESLLEHSYPVTQELLNMQERKVPFLVKVATSFIRSMM